MSTGQNKVSIIGMGNVGATSAYALLLHGVVNELVLVDRTKARAEGEKLDLEHGLSFLDPATIIATDNFAEIEGSDIVVFTAGVAQKPGETRLDLIEKNSSILNELLPKIIEHAPEAIILIVANPVDILTYKASQFVHFSPGRIFGSGTMLDTARFRFHLGQLLQVNPRSIHAYILGEHGDTSFPVLSSASVGGELLRKHKKFSEADTMAAFTTAQQAAYSIIQAKGATYYAIGVIVLRIVQTILRDAKTILPVSVPVANYYGVSNVALSVPCIVGRNGIEQVLEVELDTSEQAKLNRSASALQQYL